MNSEPEIPLAASDSKTPTRKRRRIWWLLGGAVVLFATGMLAVPYVYIHFIAEKAPPPLSFSDRDAAVDATAPALAPNVSSAGGSVAEQWSVVAPSTAGYRVNESIAGQKLVAVGRTTSVDGGLTRSGGQVTSVEVNVDLASVASDEARRDQQFRTRIMDVENFPVASFTTQQPISLPNQSGDQSGTIKVQGTLSMRGVEKEVTVDMKVQQNGSSVEVVGSIPIVFADFEIPNPSIGPVSTEDNGLIEFSVTFKKA
jgi:polyisoprenoid-binding protein YceI